MANPVGRSWQLADRGDGRGDMLPQAAAALYVSAAGDDSNDGSVGAPFQTIAKVNTLNLLPGQSVLFNRGDTFDDERLVIDDDGADNFPIVVGAYGSGVNPIIRTARVEGQYVTFNQIDFDNSFTTPRGSQPGVIEVRADNFVLQNCSVHTGEIDGVDIRGNLLNVEVRDCEIYHLVAGIFGSDDDAHGIRVTPESGNTVNLNVFDTVIRQVSGDCIQCDPSRLPNSTATITVRGGTWYTAPLANDLGGWLAGERPGEDGFDAKTDTGQTSIVTIDCEDMVLYGWLFGDGPHANATPFNIKNNCIAKLNRLTLYDNVHGFRVRADVYGNPDVEIKNCVIYNCENGVRAENNFEPVENLKIYNCTFGENITNQILQETGGIVGVHDMRNNGVIGTKPPRFSDPSNLELSSGDFVNTGGADYRLLETSSAVGGGVDLSSEGVLLDRAGNPRSAPYNVGAFTGSVAVGGYAYFNLLASQPETTLTKEFTSVTSYAGGPQKEIDDTYLNTGSGSYDPTQWNYDATEDAAAWFWPAQDESKVAGEQLRWGNNDGYVPEGPVTPFGPIGTGSMLLCFDWKFDENWQVQNRTAPGDLSTHKAYQMENNGGGDIRTFEIRHRFTGASVPFPAASGAQVCQLDVRSYVGNNGGPGAGVPGQLAPFYPVGGEWYRVWTFVDGSALSFSMWAARQDQAPVQLHNQVTGFTNATNIRAISGWWWECNSSQEGGSGIPVDSFMYGRNWICLEGLSYAEAANLVSQNSW